MEQVAWQIPLLVLFPRKWKFKEGPRHENREPYEIAVGGRNGPFA
jgi:hypothetical protein